MRKFKLEFFLSHTCILSKLRYKLRIFDIISLSSDTYDFLKLLYINRLKYTANSFSHHILKKPHRMAL